MPNIPDGAASRSLPVDDDAADGGKHGSDGEECDESKGSCSCDVHGISDRGAVVSSG
jgi:hypothetical protein